MSKESMFDAKGQDLRPPIFVWEPNDLDVFLSVDDACSYVEKYDFDILVGYDSEGRKFRFGLTKVPVIVFGRAICRRERVTITEIEPSPSSAGELKAILLTTLSALGHKIEDTLALPAIVEKATSVLGPTK